LLLLALLAEKPSHGYELIKALEERSSGYYSPSPGMVYPALTYLEELGHASVEPEGTRKLYRAAIDTLLAQLQQIGRHMQKMRRAMSSCVSPRSCAKPPPMCADSSENARCARRPAEIVAAAALSI
jgi:hypothetical protein